MAERRPLIMIDGLLKELPSADTLPGGGGGGDLIRSARTSNTMLTAADKGTLIDITSGTFSQTFDAVATLGDGWWCYLRNSGTGDITLDPNATELIDGLATYVMYPGEVRLVQCDGTTLRTVVLNSFLKTFTGSGDFVKPPGYSVFEGILWSAGASGRTGTNTAGGGGGAGFCFSLLAQALGATETVVIGAGGAQSTTATYNAGGDSTFAGLTCFGATNNTVGGRALIASAGNTNVLGYVANSLYGGAAGNSGADGVSVVYGGGSGGGMPSTPAAKVGGVSIFGGRGGDSVVGSATAQDGTAPGGGGGCSQSGTAGAGARGELRIWGLI